ncbi:hypothetical protein STCU_12111 [Strigomonas culicis]|uniref:Protein kinase domain-containing protein n=1 Tax=Strigomonas culicis TaxID=28005 RepID=S9UXQ4_9TRYP|nr:hypothetical protein STCU_12111 [Strigomonas culicis]|eukprot:EPY15330.1 hypothetical protein STCU_12111 [Strigomonas culicis]
MWACGCLLYEMLTGRMLFGEARLGRLVTITSSYRAAIAANAGSSASTTREPSRNAAVPELAVDEFRGEPAVRGAEGAARADDRTR